MKLQTLQEDLTKAISLSSRFVNPRAQLPALSNLAFAADKTKLSIFATNLEMSIAYGIGAKVEEAGEITLPVRVINDLVSNLKPGTVSLTTKGEQVTIKAADFSALVAGVNAADFPKVPQKVAKNALKIKNKDFLQSLSKVLFSVSNDETRPVLTGVLVFFDKKDLVLVATDGFRLSQKKLRLTGEYGNKRVILPKSVLSEISRVFSEKEGEVLFDIREEDNQVVFHIDNVFISSRVIEGTFPDFAKIIPQEVQIKVAVDKEELVRAVKSASVFAREAANVVKLSIGKESLSVFAENQTTGRQEAKIEAKVEGGELAVNYNYRFLLEVLNVIEDDFVEIELTNDASPGVFKDPKDPNFLHLIMPVKF